MTAQINFVKGHCGWDAVTLLPEGEIPAQEELSASVKILSAPVHGGLEIGWLGASLASDELRLRMVNSTTRNWIPMCGGMTQVIGKALVETPFRQRFGIDTSKPLLTMRLSTPAGEIPIRISIRDGKCEKVVSVMDHYVSYVSQLGIERLVLMDVPLLRVGTYCVIDVLDLEAVYPAMDFTRRDPGSHLDIVHAILREFRQRLGREGVNGMLYDRRPEGGGQYRVFPRFYSDDLAAARIPWEFQCGTGSIVVAMALAHAGHLSSEGEVKLSFEWGSYRTTPDPYGIRTSELELQVVGRQLTNASFSHSVVEILAHGTLVLPAYS